MIINHDADALLGNAEQRVTAGDIPKAVADIAIRVRPYHPLENHIKVLAAYEAGRLELLKQISEQKGVLFREDLGKWMVTNANGDLVAVGPSELLNVLDALDRKQPNGT